MKVDWVEMVLRSDRIRTVRSHAKGDPGIQDADPSFWDTRRGSQVWDTRRGSLFACVLAVLTRYFKLAKTKETKVGALDRFEILYKAGYGLTRVRSYRSSVAATQRIP